uniref:TGF-beta family profile domain-containing protein n=1 Tax=Glossina brevipalpis TaxID=37001 RepID=A0A1A9X484_9MUSC
MTKYFIAFVMFTFLAFDNGHLYRRVHVNSHPSAEFVRPKRHAKGHQLRHHFLHKHLHSDQVSKYETNPIEAEMIGREDNLTLHKLLQIRHHTGERTQYIAKRQKQLHTLEEQNQSVYSERNIQILPRVWRQTTSDYNNNDPASLALSKEKQWLENDEMPLDVIDNELSSIEAIKKVEIERDPRCPKCESNRKVAHVSEEELTQLRIEFVKHQILEKLRLKERPNVSAVGLPKPISEGVTIEEERGSMIEKEFDDYYARTSKKFIFLQVEKRECSKLGSQLSMCFSFKIDDADADSYDVSTAVLWLFKSHRQINTKRSENLLNQMTIVVSEVQQQKLKSKFLPVIKTIAIQSVNVQDEWLKIDIEWPIKRWFGNHDLSHLIQITCQLCDIGSMEQIVSTDKAYRPFIMVDTQNRRRQIRQKRSINCTDGVTECCREKLFIDFVDIGWGDWIIHPRGYDAYFCRGSCNSIASVTMATSQHSSTLQKLLSRPGNRGKHLELVPCCTAKQYSSLQLMFMDSNNTATQKTFPNMVVESCGCR